MFEIFTCQEELHKELDAIILEVIKSPVPRKWAVTLKANSSLVRNLSGFIANSVKKRLRTRSPIIFSEKTKALYRVPEWDPACPCVLTDHNIDKYCDIDREDLRKIHLLSLPDKLIHNISGRIVSNAINALLSKSAYAYRKGFGQAKAVKRVRELIHSRKNWIVKYDVEKFSETVDHKVLMALIRKTLFPLIKSPRDKTILTRVLQGLLLISEKIIGEKGKGILIGSGLSPALGNIYLTPVDRYLEGQGIDFVRYGDDLLAFCGGPDDAERVYAGIDKIVRQNLKQSANTGKSGLFHPSCPINFIGFLFDRDKDRVGISRDERFYTEGVTVIKTGTFNKVKSRIQKFTMLSKSRIELLNKKKGKKKATVIYGRKRETDADEHVDDVSFIPTIEYLLKIIYDINFFLGYKTAFDRSVFPPRGTPVFFNSNSFPANVLKCVQFEDIEGQFKRLDKYIYSRISRVRDNDLGVLYDGCKSYFPSVQDYRRMGLRTFKDVANRFMAEGSAHDQNMRKKVEVESDYYHVVDSTEEGSLFKKYEYIDYKEFQGPAQGK